MAPAAGEGRASKEARELVVWLSAQLQPLRGLEERVRAATFEAIRQRQLGDTSKAIELNRRIIATFPDKGHKEYKEAVNRLNQMDQERN